MKVDLPELDEVMIRIKNLEEIVSVLQKGKEEPPKEWYSIGQAAAYCCVCEKTIRRLIERGLLKRNIGTRHIKIHVKDLEDYIRKTRI